nr:Chain C, B-ADAPTIN 3 [synthetic construct]1C9L_D Chain D, B-ADAPTIN 3 [synthetic construct]
DTNLIEFE